MKFKFIGKEPMVIQGFGVKSPDTITEVHDEGSIGLLKKSPLFVEIDEPNKNKRTEKSEKEEDK